MDKSAETKENNFENHAEDQELQEEEVVEVNQEKSEVEELQRDLTTAKEAHLYLAAEFENYKKRQQKEKQELLLFGNEKIIRDLMGAMDGIHGAILSMPESDQTKAIVDGIKMIENMLLSTLAKHGVEKVKTEGLFDMNVHEALKRVKAEGKEKNTILEVQQEGYLLNGRLLRPAKVIVAE